MNSYRRMFAIAISMLFLFGCSHNDQVLTDSPKITRQELLQHIRYLASDELKGRRTGSAGANAASEYIVKHFKNDKILPGYDGNYFQRFDFIAGVSLGTQNSCSIFSKDDSAARQLTLDKDFRPLGFSSSGKVSADLVFAGYGITADSIGYNDYKNIDANGKVVLVLRYGPEGDNPHGDFSQYISLRYKASNAKSHGAAALIIIPGPEPYPEDELIPLKYDQSADAGIPAISAKRSVFSQFFAAAGDSLEAVQHQMNAEKTGLGFPLEGVRIDLETEVTYTHKNGRNVVGIIPGQDSLLKKQYIVIGAHYDHLGMGGEGSLAPDTIAVHNGADDNASGTAGVLELADYFSRDGYTPRRSLVFVAFSGEEEGLLGSSAFTENPPFALKQTDAMINMDMIGRMQDSTLIIGGVGTSPTWDSLITAINQHYHWKLTENNEGYGPSDHSSFYIKNIPVLFFFTGVHEDYHRPTDDWDKIHYADEVGVLDYVRDMIKAIDQRDSTLQFTRAGGKQERAMQFRVSLQIIPDYAAQVHGLRIADVHKGGTADKAGMQAGDIITKFGGKEINNIYDYTYALQEFAPGSVVDVVVMRNGTPKRFTVKLEHRK